MPPTHDPTASRQPFPWVLLGILGVGLLFVVGVVVAFFLRGNPLPGLGAFCAQQEPRCARGLVCSANNLCLGAEGALCSSGDECASHECLQGACVTPLSTPGGPCDEDADCVRPSVCEADQCLLPEGQTCTRAELCRSGRCENGKCQPPESPGAACKSDEDCPEPTHCYQGLCLRLGGAACERPAQCISGRCDNGTCRKGTPPGSFCRETGDCVAPAKCTNNLCLLAEDATCGRDTDCETGNCQRGVCRRGCSPPCGAGSICDNGECRRTIVVPSLRACTADKDCSAPSRCDAGRCRRPSGETCAIDDQCVSRGCVDGRCR